MSALVSVLAHAGRSSAVLVVTALVVACGSTGPNGTAAAPRSGSSAPSRAPSPESSATTGVPPSGGSIANPSAPSSAAAFHPNGLHVGFTEVAAGLDAPLAIANAHDG